MVTIVNLPHEAVLNFILIGAAAVPVVKKH